MEHTKKFYFVPPDILAKLNEKSEHFKQISSNLEKDVTDTVAKKGSKAKQMPADRRAILYSQYLQKYLTHKNKLTSPLSPIVKVSDKDKSSSVSAPSDIEKIKNDIDNLQTVFNEKYNELVHILQEYWGKGAEEEKGKLDIPFTSAFHRSSTPHPKSSLSTSASADQLAQQISEADDGSSTASEGTLIKKGFSIKPGSTRHRKGRTRSVQKLIDELPLNKVEELAKKLHERVTRSKASSSKVGKPGQSGRGFGGSKWKTYYQYKL